MVEHIGICYGHENEPEECREKGEPPADWLEQPIEDQRHADIACAHDQLGGAAENIQWL